MRMMGAGMNLTTRTVTRETKTCYLVLTISRIPQPRAMLIPSSQPRLKHLLPRSEFAPSLGQ